MPELPEVETVRRGLIPLLLGRTIERIVIRDSRLRYPVAKRRLQALLSGRKITAIKRRGKYLLISCGSHGILLAHLGMTGRFQFCTPRTAQASHTHAIFYLSGRKELRFVDPRRFGMLEAIHPEEVAKHSLLVDLGPEPLSPQFDGTLLSSVCHNRKRPIKNLIMDAKVVVGVGNIYASEALHWAGIHPHRAAGRLSHARIETLVDAIKNVLGRAISVGGTTLRDFSDPNEEAGYFAIELAVYDREGQPCHTCARVIKRSIQGNRSTFYCPACQR